MIRIDRRTRRAAAAFLIGLLVATTAACGGSPGSAGPSGSGAAASGAPSAALASPSPVVRPVPGHEVYGFVPYWEMDEDIADHLATTDLTTLALFSVTHRKTGELATNQNGFKRITGAIGQRMIREAQDRGVRVELTYTSFGGDKNRAFYDTPASQARWIDELIDMVVDQGFDGINVDVELLPIDLVAPYGAFVGRLRDALRERLPEAQVSVSTQANEVGAAMAAAAAAAGADRVFLMGYDYHWTGSAPGASAPIDRLDGTPKDLVWSLDLYEALGVPLDRTLLGLPLYGISWPVVGPELGAPNTERGEDWVPRYNLGVLNDPSFAPTYDPIESVEFYAVPAESPGAWDSVYYDSPRSLTPKLMLADERGLAGAGFWAIGYERGLPDYTELIATFRAGEIGAVAP